jgi:hypothetical protein
MIESTNNGLYNVDGTFYRNKTEAFIEASKKSTNVSWWFFDDVWDNFSKTKLHTLGAVPLDDLYKARAQQLRDSYDYLVLNYSGGADSHNILMTFINNNIKLDEVFVKWSYKVESKIYTPDPYNKDAENIFSEWDYAIKPTLDWLAIHHPEIKINIGELFTEDPEQTYGGETFNNLWHWTGWIEILRMRTISDSLYKLADKGLKVAQIYGIDKPNISFKDNKCYLFFTDLSTSSSPDGLVSSWKTPIKTEAFYWTPDMPEIAFNQAHACMKYFGKDKALMEIIEPGVWRAAKYTLANDDSAEARAMKLAAIKIHNYYDITKRIIYTTWDNNTFQVNKPEIFSYAGRSRDKKFFEYKDTELSRYFDTWDHHFQSWRKSVDPSLLTGMMNMQQLSSKPFLLGKIE